MNDKIKLGAILQTLQANEEEVAQARANLPDDNRYEEGDKS